MEKIGDIQNRLKQAIQRDDPDQLLDFILRYKSDDRAGVQKLIKRANKAEIAWHKEEERIQKLRFFEDKYKADYHHIAGIDEVGRGPLAGPVMTCAVILPEGYHLHGINDSKKLSEKKREELFLSLQRDAVSLHVGVNSPERIDEINILQATYEAMRMSIDGLNPQADLLLIDAVHIPEVTIPEVSIIKGDAKSISIGAASILAKVTRDHYMEEMDARYPEYHFRENKGYGTKDHIDALRKYGPCPIHRRSFITHFI